MIRQLNSASLNSSLFKILSFSLLVFLFLSSFLAAEENLGHQESFYHLKVGDKLTISLYGEHNTKREVTVSATGTISYLFVNAIAAQFKTIPEIKKALTEKLKKFYRFPVLIITGAEFIGEHYTMVGEIKNPGKKSLFGDASLLGAICTAGGFTTRLYREQTIDLADLDHSFLSRQGQYVPLNFSTLILQGDMSQNVKLQPGDYIYIASFVMPKVYVLGEVNRNVTINYINTIRLAEALSQAGGITLRASSRAIVIRGALSAPTTYEIDINRIFKGYACDFWLQPGDIIYVPPMKFTTIKEMVQGGVSAFISTLASVAGTNTFLEITPKAKRAGVTSPVQVIGTGATVPTIPFTSTSP